MAMAQTHRAAVLVLLLLAFARGLVAAARQPAGAGRRTRAGRPVGAGHHPARRLGVVTIDAANETDAMRALGYVHAQERYFEMDLMRRTAAGELAALFGPIALDLDKRAPRASHARARAANNSPTSPATGCRELRAYTEGVNAGLAALRARPWPYLLLRQQPQPWRIEDSALVGDAMYFDLQDAQARARTARCGSCASTCRRRCMRCSTHDGTQLGRAAAGRRARRCAAARRRTRSTCASCRCRTAAQRAAIARTATTASSGSNNFAVSGALTTDGRAIVADDMHLGLRAPNIWFRARLRYPDPRAPGGKRRRAGLHPARPAAGGGRQQRPRGMGLHQQLCRHHRLGASGAMHARAIAASRCAARRSRTHRETIDVAGASRSTLDVEDTAWGPVLRDEPDGAALALRWTAHLPGALNLGLADMARAARSRRRRCAVADRAAIPTQNMIVADSAAAASPGACSGRCRSAPATARAAPGRGCRARSTRSARPRRADGRALRGRSRPPRPARCRSRRRAPVDGQQPRARRRRPAARRRRRLRPRRARAADPRRPVGEASASTNATCWRSSSTTARCSCNAGGNCCATKRGRATIAGTARARRRVGDAGTAAPAPDSTSYRIVRAWRLAVHRTARATA